MVACKFCDQYCLRVDHRENKVCCFCTTLDRDNYCDGCKSKLSILDDLERDAEDSMKEILSSGIHYWYKLKYEFNILKYLTHQVNDFNKYDKQSFAKMAHDGEFFMGIRSSGTDFIDLDLCLVQIKDVMSHGVVPLMKSLKVYIQRSDIFYWGNKGRIEFVPAFQINSKIKDWMETHNIWSYKANDALY